MAKKDLLERLSQAPTTPDGAVRRTEGAVDPATGQGLVETRVNRTVVRRRKSDEPEEKPVETKPETVTTLRRRRPIDEAPKPAAPVAEQPRPEPARVEEPPAQVVEEPVAARTPEPAPQREPEPEPVVAAPPEPEPEPEPIPEPVAAAPAPVADDRGMAAVPAEPRFQGLGKAVVMPPPGYDPTNPNTWRPERERPRPAPAPAAAAAAPESAFPGRRRVAAESDFPTGRRPRKAGRRGTGGKSAQDVMLPRRKPGRRANGAGAAAPGITVPKAIKRRVRVDNVISVSQLAHEMGVKSAAVIKQLLGMGHMATANDMLDLDTATLVAAEFEYQVENVGFSENEFIPQVGEAAEEEGLSNRPPVVTIMGHVDHGKTTLLDAIRNARVAAGEAGGITQHIGAYQVDKDGQKITFIDTPGHAAFTEMRARGAKVTDIVVLVVAADDGVQPQTEEAIAHAKAANVPIVVAVNKMDKPGVKSETIKTKLSELGLQPEEWGGETLYAEVSALKKTGIDALLGQILLQAEVLELKANPDRHGEGIVIESKMERGRGAVATVLVQKGMLKRGDFIVLGAVYGKVRAMVDHNGQPLKEAGPATPVEIFGLSDLPEVGDVITAVENEKNAKTLAEHRATQQRQEEMSRQRKKTAEDLFALARGEEKEYLDIVLKCDVQGSLQALRQAIEAIKVEGTEVRILQSGVGPISESDVNLSAANNALLIGFNVNLGPNARQAASSLGVEPQMYDVIYGVLDKVNALLRGKLEPVYELVRRGTAEVRALFKISKVGTIAGSMVTDGTVARVHTAKVVRGEETVWEGRISTLKRFKDDVKEVASGYECGIGLDGYEDLHEGDKIETYSREEVVRE